MGLDCLATVIMALLKCFLPQSICIMYCSRSFWTIRKRTVLCSCFSDYGGSGFAHRILNRKRLFHICGFFISFLCMTYEGMLLHTFDIQRHDSMYFSLLPCMYFLFAVILSVGKAACADTEKYFNLDIFAPSFDDYSGTGYCQTNPLSGHFNRQ